MKHICKYGRKRAKEVNISFDCCKKRKFLWNAFSGVGDKLSSKLIYIEKPEKHREKFK